MPTDTAVRIAIVTVSDRASRGEYADLGGPEVEAWLRYAIASPFETVRRLIPDGRDSVRTTLISLCDEEKADLVLTTGGTGPAPRDETPDGTRAVLDRELPGFGELLRQAGLAQTPTAILSRQTAGVRGSTLIVNLPGRPASIRLSLNAVFPSIPYCLDLIGAGRIETDPSRIVSFRPSR
ncbi:molybdopterin adenylyltransferase (plasmid) [Rhizobium sp. TRM96647]|uniref:molybdopterin adenylyltransferase n=1 Tax=unclassified Rhizobium TaxID=2613769 RepID=UPI0021E8E19D|nr:MULTISPECIES: molybdopterin adenylyltransferase [unclassified Rhizobium]MCV3735280.1 molybdopterin adenylyltransferase [Rhizobium sp. TRM96647]MCV3757957.1 molybdopterin adenylyltransferase [Rhizobium sp. TRM96650]